MSLSPNVERIIAETQRLRALAELARIEAERPAKEEADRKAQRKAWVKVAMADQEKALLFRRNTLKMQSRSFPMYSPEWWAQWQLIHALDELEEAIRVKFGLTATIDNFGEMKAVTR